MKQLSRWLNSLQAQLILWAILPVTLVVIGLALTGVYSHQQAMSDFVVKRDQIMARTIALRLEEALSHGDLSPDSADVGDWLPIADRELPGTVWVVDGDRSLLAGSGDPEGTQVQGLPGIEDVFRAEEGAIIVPDSPAGPQIITFSTVQGTNWRVVIREPAQDLIGPILRFSSLGPIAALIAAGLSVLMLSFGWRTIVRPLQRLSRFAGEVSWGRRTVIEDAVGGVAEIEDLHLALTEMVQRLEAYQAGVLDYLDAVTKGQEEERARLARELHDGPVQSLIALSQRAEMAQHRLQRSDPAGAEALLDTLRTAQVTVIEDLRRTIGALRPAYLEDLGFLPALEMLVQAANTRNDVRVRLEVGSEVPRLHPEQELAAYRIAEESLNNALHHAFAREITVRVRCDLDGLALEVQDDGVGFEPTERLDSYTREGHFGLVGLQERVRQLGGSLQIKATTGLGTTIRVRMPYTLGCG